MSVDHRLANLYLSIRSGLAHVVTSIVSPGEVEDIVQETYVRVCQASVAKEIRSPKAFMLKTARNLALDHVRRAGFRLVDPIDDKVVCGMTWTVRICICPRLSRPIVDNGSRQDAAPTETTEVVK